MFRYGRNAGLLPSDFEFPQFASFNLSEKFFYINHKDRELFLIMKFSITLYTKIITQ